MVVLDGKSNSCYVIYTYLVLTETRQYAYNNWHILLNSLFKFFRNSFLLTGNVENIFDNATVVPIDLDVIICFRTFPLWSYSICVAVGAFSCFVVITTLDRAHKELSASPLKPKVVTDSKSANCSSFDVQCLRAEIVAYCFYLSYSNIQLT